MVKSGLQAWPDCSFAECPDPFVVGGRYDGLECCLVFLGIHVRLRVDGGGIPVVWLVGGGPCRRRCGGARVCAVQSTRWWNQEIHNIPKMTSKAAVGTMWAMSEKSALRPGMLPWRTVVCVIDAVETVLSASFSGQGHGMRRVVRLRRRRQGSVMRISVWPESTMAVNCCPLGPWRVAVMR